MRVVWTDECNFSTAGFSHRPWVTGRPEEEFHPDCIDEVWQSGRKSVMVWGAFCGEMKSQLDIVPPGTTMNSKKYRDNVMIPYLVPFWHQTCEEYGWTKVVEDNSPGHQGYAKSYWALNGIDYIPWPPQSPDLNLIEAFWAEIETELGQIYEWALDEDTLIMMLRVAWADITPERHLQLIRSMRRRLEAVIAAGGNATLY